MYNYIKISLGNIGFVFCNHFLLIDFKISLSLVIMFVGILLRSTRTVIHAQQNV